MECYQTSPVMWHQTAWTLTSITVLVGSGQRGTAQEMDVPMASLLLSHFNNRECTSSAPSVKGINFDCFTCQRVFTHQCEHAIMQCQSLAQSSAHRHYYDDCSSFLQLMPPRYRPIAALVTFTLSSILHDMYTGITMGFFFPLFIFIYSINGGETLVMISRGDSRI